MKRTTLMLPEDLKNRAERRAYSSGLSLGGFIREAIEKALRSDASAKPNDPFLTDDAVYEGETGIDLAKKHDNYLYGD